MHSTPEEFEHDQLAFQAAYAEDPQFDAVSLDFYRLAARNKYTYTWNWLGLPVIQFPNDLLLMQDLIWRTKPSVVIETGVARGGSLAFYASMLHLTGGSLAIGVDVHISHANRSRINQSPLADSMELIEGSSIEASTVSKVKSLVGDSSPVLLVLDSNHEHGHVLRELELWTPLVTPGSYCVVFDTTCARLPVDDFRELEDSYALKDWGYGRNPGSAVETFLGRSKDFDVDPSWHQRAMITNCWGGFLKRHG